MKSFDYDLTYDKTLFSLLFLYSLNFPMHKTFIDMCIKMSLSHLLLASPNIKNLIIPIVVSWCDASRFPARPFFKVTCRDETRQGSRNLSYISLKKLKEGRCQYRFHYLFLLSFPIVNMRRIQFCLYNMLWILPLRHLQRVSYFQRPLPIPFSISLISFRPSTPSR